MIKMPRNRTARSPGRLADEQGVGLILVIGISAVVMMLIATALTIGVNALKQSTIRTNYELSLAAAETGIDVVLARQQAASIAGDFDGIPIPNTSGVELSDSGTLCTGNAWANGDVGSTSEEIRASLELVAADPGCLQTTETGQYVALRPTSGGSAGHVYSLGWAPSKADGRNGRLVSVDYFLAPYTPSHAVLTGGDIDIGGSVTIDQASGVAFEAGVHTNGSLEMSTGSTIVCGKLSGTGGVPNTTYTNPCESGAPQEPEIKPPTAVPVVNAEGFHGRAAWIASTQSAILQDKWFDLCPTASGFDTRERNVNENQDPCTGDVRSGNPANVAYSSTKVINGSTYGPTFSLTNSSGDGIYYAHHANLVTEQGGLAPATDPKRTLIASVASTCDVTTGNISYTHQDMANGPWDSTELFMMADMDLEVNANVVLGDPDIPVGGMFVAGDDLTLNTSSNDMVGATMSADQCESATGELVEENSIQGVNFYLYPGGGSPFATVMNVTAWREL